MSLSPSVSAPWIALGLTLLTACGEPVIPDELADGGLVADLASPAMDMAMDLAPPPDAASGPPVACGAILPGPPLKDGLTESQPGYAEALAALDVSMLPDPFDYGAESKLTVAVINFMLGRAAGTSITHGDARAAGGLGRAVLGAAARGAGKVDFAFLRRGLHHFYPCSRPVPPDLAELRRRFGDYRGWPAQEIACSKPKDGPRRLRQDPAQGIYIAETVVNGAVRETEVLFTALRRDGQFDFAAYTDEGKLTDRSTFATTGGGVTSAAPYTCMTCHLNTTTWTFSVLTPTGTGAGCR